MFNKVFEKTMYKQLYLFHCNYKLKNPKQLGFRANHSTEHGLLSLFKALNYYSTKVHIPAEFLMIFKK